MTIFRNTQKTRENTYVTRVKEEHILNWPDHWSNVELLMHNLEAVSAQRLYRLIAERIAEKIRSGEFLVGTRLPAERDLADILQVSRSSVREALIALELSGYVEVRVGSGVYVMATRGNEASLPMSTNATGTSRSLSEMASDIGPFELLETRLLIEPECAAQAAQKGMDKQLAKIREAQEGLSEAGAPSHHDRAFHAAIAAASGNAALEAVVSHIWDLTEASPVYERLDKHFVNGRVWDVALLEHERIADAILERDPIRARHAMYAHLIAIMARLREDLANSVPTIATRPAAGSKVHQLRLSR
jgi:DNA-binding FadR family transcriptional regulator